MLPIGKSIVFREIEMLYSVLPFYGAGIQNGLTVSKEASQMIELNTMHPRHKTGLESLFVTYIDSMQQIAQGSLYKHTLYSEIFRTRLFDSTAFILGSDEKTLIKRWCLLTQIDQHTSMRIRKHGFCYIFNARSQKNKISIIKHDYRESAGFIGKKLRCNMPTIFTNVEFNKDSNLFIISKASFVLFDFCTDFLHTLRTGNYHNHFVRGMKTIWPRPKDKFNDKAINWHYKIPIFKSLKEAQMFSYIVNNTEKKVLCCLNIKHIINLYGFSAQFKTYCRGCNQIHLSLQCNCCTDKSNHSIPQLHCSTTMDITSNKMIVNKHKIGVNMTGIKYMFQFLKDNKIITDDIKENMNFIKKSFENKERIWTKNEQCSVFIPIIKQYFKLLLLQQSDNIMVIVQITENNQMKLLFYGSERDPLEPNRPKRKLSTFDQSRSAPAAKKQKIMNV